VIIKGQRVRVTDERFRFPSERGRVGRQAHSGVALSSIYVHIDYMVG
jgi:hypothetical protein